MRNKVNLVAAVAKKAAEHALRRDANQTTCASIYQPKVPAELKYYKKERK